MLRLQFAQRGSQLETLDYFYEFQLVELRDEGQGFFRCSVWHFSASSLELRPFVSGLPINSQGLWTYAFLLKDRVKNNNNNNNNTIWGVLFLPSGWPNPT